MPRRRNAKFPINASREFERAVRFRECEERGYHLRRQPAVREEKLLGGERVDMELCRHCDVWVEPMKFLHDDLYEELGYE